MSPVSLKSNRDLKADAKGNENGNGAVDTADDHADVFHDGDAFQHLPKPQQDVLLLHGPRQKYSLQTTGQIPELRSEREVLIQVRRHFRYTAEVLTATGRGHWVKPSGLEGPVRKTSETIEAAFLLIPKAATMISVFHPFLGSMGETLQGSSSRLAKDLPE